MFGAASTPAATGGLFGSTTPAATTAPSAGLSQVKANVLEHRPVDELLASWESRIAQQASVFQKFASDVVSVDKQLIQSARRLKELSDEHTVLKQKSQHVDAAVKSVWDHQEALGKLLSHIQDELSRDRSAHASQYAGSSLSGAGSSSERAAALWSQLMDMETDVDDIIRDIERIGTGAEEEVCGSNLSGLTKLIKLHAHSIASLQQQTNDIKHNLP